MALGYVYRQGLIHRDVKPANLLAMVERGRVLDVKITDFGSVLNLDADTHAGVPRRLAGLHVARAARRRRRSTARADMYSLAAVLYHLIAGRPPFEAHAPAGDDAPDLQRRAAAAGGPARRRARGAATPIVRQALAKIARRPPRRLGRVRAGAVGAGGAPRGAARRAAARCSTPSASTCCARSSSSAGFGDVELWEVVHRASWQRHAFGHALFQQGPARRQLPHHRGRPGRGVPRRSARWPQLGPGTSVGEMAYLAPSPDLRVHSADVRGLGGGDHGVVHARDDGAAVASPRATCSTRPSSACWCGGCTPPHEALAPPAAHPVSGSGGLSRRRGAGRGRRQRTAMPRASNPPAQAPRPSVRGRHQATLTHLLPPCRPRLQPPPRLRLRRQA